MLFGVVMIMVFGVGRAEPLVWFGMLNSFAGVGCFLIFCGLVCMYGVSFKMFLAGFVIAVGVFAIIWALIYKGPAAPQGRCI